MSKKQGKAASGFTIRQPQLEYSLLPTSPFRSDGEAWKGGASNIQPDMGAPHMGTILTREVLDKDGSVRHRASRMRIRIACEHWALDKKAVDCRFGCEAKSQVAMFTP